MSVSAWAAPWASATRASSDDETTLETTSRPGPDVTSASSQSPSRAPDVVARQPAGPPAGAGDQHTQAVGVGVEGEPDGGAGLAP